MTADDEHATLASAWNGIRRILEGMPTSIRFVDVHYVEVSDKAERVKSLGLHLEGTVSLMHSERSVKVLTTLPGVGPGNSCTLAGSWMS